uniref:uncharacterized protein LOC122596657 isoform X2 n=1 Tax=Erigeron canadensis TaxID=72917 RepID=UPI001CB89ABC|nr:uncharacterized protein LOC122596657 isoform X2 [Erigeron canadensis]
MLLSALSEGEESGAFKVTEKGKKCDKFKDKSGKNVYTMSIAPPTRKSKLEKGEGHADGVSRGRSGQGFGSSRFTAPMKGEKLGCTGTAKQLRTAILPFDKSESKLGQLSTRELSDHRASKRQKHTAASTTSDFLGQALSSPFWRQVDQDIISSTVTTPKTVASDIDNSSMLSNGMDARNVELDSDPLAPRTPSPVEIPLCQRLLSALISEDENAEPTSCVNDGLKCYIYDTKFEVETEVESNIFSERSFQNMELSGHDAFSGYGIKSTRRSCSELKHNLSDNQIISMNERLLLEIQSIGLYPQLVPDLAHTGEEDISKDIGNLEIKHQEKVFRMENQLGKLLRSATEIRQLQEKEFEQHSLDKVTKLAYQKYMSCRGPNAPGGKSAKLAKQDALALVKQTLDQCQKFETTGNICLDEPLFREMFVSASSPFIDSQLSSETKIDASQLYGNSMERAPGTQKSLHNIYIGAKGKISKRDKEWTGSNGFKVGQPALNNTEGERQTKTKLQQNAARLSNSNNGPQFKISDHHKPTDEIKFNNVKENVEYDEPLVFCPPANS